MINQNKNKNFFNFLSKNLENFFFPPSCLGCQEIVTQKNLLCAKCWREIYFITPPICDVYGIPLSFQQGNLTLSTKALYKPPFFRKARSAVLHKGLGKKLITQFKYNDQLHLLPFIADFMQNAGRELILEADFLIPVPLHFFRYLFRRYNQSLELARYLAKKNKKNYLPNVIKRIRHTEKQALLNFSKRQNNVRNAFFIPKSYYKILFEKKILLIDDVYTTGATINEVTKTLLKANVKQVDVLTFSCTHDNLFDSRNFSFKS